MSCWWLIQAAPMAAKTSLSAAGPASWSTAKRVSFNHRATQLGAQSRAVAKRQVCLDADEEIGTRCQQAIQQAIQHPATADGYQLTPRYWFLGAG